MEDDERARAIEQAINDAADLLRTFDNTPLNKFGPLFYQHGYEELSLALRELLHALGHDAR